jgi:disease resistance protein RPM1
MIEEIRNLTTEVSLLRDRYRLDDFPSERPKILTGKKKSTLDGYTAPEHQQAIHRLICIKEPVGVREDMLKLQDWIMSRDANLGVLSIFGFGGVGKTTIAMALYKRCRNQFKSRAVITGLSQYTDPATVLRYILSQIRPQVNNTGIILENKISRTTRRMANGLHRISQCCRNQEDMTSAMEDDVLSRELSQYLQEDRYVSLLTTFSPCIIL